MSTKPDLKVWAESICYLAREGLPASDRVMKAVEDELKIIADKYFQLGDKDGWWKDQETKQSNALLEVVENLKREFPNGFSKRISDDG